MRNPENSLSPPDMQVMILRFTYFPNAGEKTEKMLGRRMAPRAFDRTPSGY